MFRGLAVYVVGPSTAPCAIAKAVDRLRADGVEATGPAYAMSACELDVDAVAESAWNDVDNVLAADVVAALPGTPATCPDVVLAHAVGVPVVPLGGYRRMAA